MTTEYTLLQTRGSIVLTSDGKKRCARFKASAARGFGFKPPPLDVTPRLRVLS